MPCGRQFSGCGGNIFLQDVEGGWGQGNRGGQEQDTGGRNGKLHFPGHLPGEAGDRATISDEDKKDEGGSQEEIPCRRESSRLMNGKEEMPRIGHQPSYGFRR